MLENNITKEYLDKAIDVKIESMMTRFEKHIASLSFELDKSMDDLCLQINKVNERLDRVENKVIDIDTRLSSVQSDVFYIKKGLFQVGQ